MRSLLLLLLAPVISLAAEVVIVSVYPFYDVVKELSAGRFDTEVLIPPRADYHLYELSTREILKIHRAKLIFVSGVPLGGWERKVEALGGDKVVRLAEGLVVKTEEGIRIDPHLWLSPRRMVGVARNAYEALSEREPESRELFTKNYKEVLKKLKELDGEYRNALKSCKFKVLPIIHPALGYLARDYGLKQLSIGSGDVHGGVSPKELARFVANIKELGIDFIFGIYGVRSKYTDILAEEHGLKVFRINVKIIPSEHGKDYFSIMRYNLGILREALRCTY